MLSYLSVQLCPKTPPNLANKWDLVGFNKLIHSDVHLGNAKCTILVLNMRWDKMHSLHSLNLIDQELEVSTD